MPTTGMVTPGMLTPPTWRASKGPDITILLVLGDMVSNEGWVLRSTMCRMNAMQCFELMSVWYAASCSIQKQDEPADCEPFFLSIAVRMED